MARNYQQLTMQDNADARSMAYTISGYLHVSTKTIKCQNPLECLMCMNAARLAVQHYRPIIEARVVDSLMSLYNVRCTMPHPGDD